MADEILQDEVVQQDPPTKASKLYANLLSKKYTADKLGTEEEFTKALSDPLKADKIYSSLEKDGLKSDEIGTKQEFLQTFQKKNNSLSFSGANPFLPPVANTVSQRLDGKPEVQPTNTPQTEALKNLSFEGLMKSVDIERAKVDPVGVQVQALKAKKDEVLAKNIKSDNTHIPLTTVMTDVRGKQKVVVKGEDEINNLDNEIQSTTASAFPTTDDAKAYLNTRITGKPVTIANASLAEQNPVAATQDVSNYSLESIKNNLDPNNLTDALAFKKYKKTTDLNNSLLNSANLFEAAINFKTNQDGNFKKQVEALNKDGQKLPQTYEGAIIADFLNTPEIIEKAQADPNFATAYRNAKTNLYVQYPEYAKKVVAQKISQKREDKGMNNPVVNIPLKSSTDDVVNEMVASGELTEQEKRVYEKSIAPTLGVFNSIGRGVGRIATGAFVDKAEIETPGLLENTQNSMNDAIHGIAHSVEDVGFLTSGNKIMSDGQRLQQTLQNEHDAVNIAPHSVANYVGQSIGHLTGSMIPLIVGGIAGKIIGAPSAITEAVNLGLNFGGNNRDQALKMFPGDIKKQYTYTALATGIDIGLGKLLPTGKAAEGTINALKTDARQIVTEFTEGKITEAAARKTILDKFTQAANYAGKIGEANLHTATVMTAFGVAHNALDVAFGGKDISLGEAGAQAIESFSTALIGSTGLSVMAANSGSPKLNGKLIMGIAKNPEKWIKTVNEEAALNPDIAHLAADKVQNITDAAAIKTDLDKITLTDPQKEKYILQALSQKVYERKAEATTDDVIKKGYLEKAKENQLAKEKIYKGEDAAPEHTTYQPTEKEVAPEPIVVDEKGNVVVTPQEDIKAEEKPADVVGSGGDALKDLETTTKALEVLPKGEQDKLYPNKERDIEGIPLSPLKHEEGNQYDRNNAKSISAAYHADKAASKETELTKAVEKLLSTKHEVKADVISNEVTTPKVEESPKELTPTEVKKNTKLKEATKPDIHIEDLKESDFDNVESKTLTKQVRQYERVKKNMDALKELITCIWT